MQTVTSSEFCRIVKKVSLVEYKGMSSLAHIGEDHGTCEETGRQHGGTPRYKGRGMYEKCVWNWRDPTCHRKVMTNNSKEKVRQLQNKLYLTAKKCSSRRFHALYDKVYREDILMEAWKRVKENQGSGGVDGIRIEDIEAIGVEK